MRPTTASKSPSHEPLVSASFSNKKVRERSRTKSRGRSRERMPSPILNNAKIVSDDDVLNNLGLDIIRSFSDVEDPDDIFDMQERYSGPQTSFTMNLIPALATSEESREEQDDGRSSEGDDSFSASQASFDEHENYITKIMERFQIRDVFEGLQSVPAKTLAITQPVAISDKDHKDHKTTELKVRLRKEIERTKELEEKLLSTQKKYDSHHSDYQSKITALEAKIVLQERIFSSQLEVEKQKRMQLEDARKEKDGVAMINAQGDRDKIQSLMATVQQLRGEIAVLKKENVTLEASIQEREIQFQQYADTTTMQIKDLQQQRKETEQDMEAQAAKMKKIQLDLNKTQTMLELEKKRSRTLEQSEARAQTLLTAERHRIETITNLNERMKCAIRKLSKKAINKESNENDQVEDLRKLLQKREQQIFLIKGILSTQQKLTWSICVTSIFQTLGQCKKYN